MADALRTHIAAASEAFELHAVDQVVEPSHKPLGLWYEVDGDWRRWCRDEAMDHWLAGGHLYRLELGAERILRLVGARDLDRFTDKYGADFAGLTIPKLLAGDSRFEVIRWAAVAEAWDGIEIAPYVWSRRLQLTWYYGWDCASGVIWRPRGARVELIGPAQQAPDVVPTSVGGTDG